MKLSVATVFLGTEGFELSPREGCIWDPRSTQPADFPTDLNALRVPRPVIADAPVLLFRHAAPRRQKSFPTDIIPCGTRGLSDYQSATLIDLHEVQEY